MKPLVSDEWWAHIAPLLPKPHPRRIRYPGRYPIPPRQVLTGILFVLKTGINRNDLPRELNCGSGSRWVACQWAEQAANIASSSGK